MFGLSPREFRTIIFLLLIIVAGCGGYWYWSHQTRPVQLTQILTPSAGGEGAVSVSSSLVVHITGAVNKPGVYHLPSGSRVYQAIDAAGKATNKADLNQINLAEHLQDGTRIVVPEIQAETTTQLNPTAINISNPNPVKNIPPAPRLINLNTASLSDLDQLSGIGPAYAQRIIDYRNQRGGFRRTEELMNIKGIGEKRYMEIRHLVTTQ